MERTEKLHFVGIVVGAGEQQHPAADMKVRCIAVQIIFVLGILKKAHCLISVVTA